jgi:hydroxymethylpyrimidine/phosphomethylpyrimidine kinase
VQNQPSPLILTFGLADPVGALGVQADLAAFAAHGCHGLSVATAQLAADSARVESMQEVDTDWLVDQARVLLEDMPVAAFKIGALANAEQAAAIAEIVSDYPDAPLLLDPFLSSLPDAGMLDEELTDAIRQVLVPQATLLMLSQVELARMAETWRDGAAEATLGTDVATLTGSGCEYVLVTGTAGVQPGMRSNTLFNREGPLARLDWQPLTGPFVGAGSTLSAALTALLARVELDATEALQAAQDYTTEALLHAQRFGMGKYIPNRYFRLARARG